MKFQRYYIYLIITLALVLNWVVVSSGGFGRSSLNLGLLPKKSLIIIELFQALILAYVLLKYKKLKFPLISIVTIGLFVVFNLIVHQINGYEVTVWVSGLRHYFSFVPILLLGYALGSIGYEIKSEFKLLMILLFLQVPVSTVQYLSIKALVKGSDVSVFDVVSGTMGGSATNLLATLLSIGIVYFLILFLNKRKPKFLLGAFILIVPTVLGSAKGMYIILVIISIYLMKAYKASLKNIILLSLVYVTIVFGFIFLYSSLEAGKTLDVEFLTKYAQEDSGRGRLSRIESITNAFDIIFDEQSPLFGMGIGSANTNPLGEDAEYNDPFIIRHSIDRLIIETGFLGLFFLTLIIGYMYMISRRVSKQIPDYQQFNKDITLLVSSMIIVFAIALFWDDILFRVQFMYPFGLLTGYVLGMYYRLTKSKNIYNQII
ncbi:MAG: hypothetical protein ABJK11_14400 [Balneola sp.]